MARSMPRFTCLLDGWDRSLCAHHTGSRVFMPSAATPAPPARFCQTYGPGFGGMPAFCRLPFLHTRACAAASAYCYRTLSPIPTQTAGIPPPLTRSTIAVGAARKRWRYTPACSAWHLRPALRTLANSTACTPHCPTPCYRSAPTDAHLPSYLPYLRYHTHLPIPPDANHGGAGARLSAWAGYNTLRLVYLF